MTAVLAAIILILSIFCGYLVTEGMRKSIEKEFGNRKGSN